MQQTNYYIFDWLDFDKNLSRDESLWKAYPQTEIHEENGDVILNIPYQKQVLQADMLADENVEMESHPLRLRAYGDSIVRLFTTMIGDEISDERDMLPMDSRLLPTPLSIETDGHG